MRNCFKCEIEFRDKKIDKIQDAVKDVDKIYRTCLKHYNEFEKLAWERKNDLFKFHESEYLIEPVYKKIQLGFEVIDKYIIQCAICKSIHSTQHEDSESQTYVGALNWILDNKIYKPMSQTLIVNRRSYDRQQIE